MATEIFLYDPTRTPQDVCNWVTAHGGRAVIAGVTAMGVIGVVIDTGFDTPAKLIVPGDKLSYNTTSKKLVVSLGIDLKGLLS